MRVTATAAATSETDRTDGLVRVSGPSPKQLQAAPRAWRSRGRFHFCPKFAGPGPRARWFSSRIVRSKGQSRNSRADRFCYILVMRIRVLALGAALIFTFAKTGHAADPDPWIARDKAFHFDASAGIAAAGYAVSAGWLVDARWKALGIGGGVALAAGAAKELVDATHLWGGDPSWKDFTWDVLGTLAGLALAWGVDLLLGGVSSQRPALASP